MPAKLIVLMIDGVSADYFATERARLPHLHALAERGFVVENLHSEVLGTSLPGRTSMMTGATADISGVYANRIWDSGTREFRYANPDDVRVPTLPARAKDAGLDVAVLGFGMIRPEDAHIFKPPWWVAGFIQRARDSEPTPSDLAWLRAAFHPTAERFEAMCQAAGLSHGLPMIDLNHPVELGAFKFMADMWVTDWVGAAAVAADAPDLIVAEYLNPDSYQHDHGYKSELAHYAIMLADAAVGRIVQRLQTAGVADQWHLAIMSDHGHSAIDQSINVAVVLPGVTVQCEGGSLIVAYRDQAELDDVAARLAVYGCEPFPNTCIPPEQRGELAIFVAPPRITFEDNHPDNPEPLVTPKALSSHGLRPGLPGDDRFAVFAGPTVTPGRAQTADAVQVAPTLAKLLGLSLDGYAAAPIF